jgi:hypothetical protein
MAQFLRADELLQSNDGLNYINYTTINESNKEFLRSDVWDFTWTSTPNAVYFPGNALVKARTRSVSPSFNVGLGGMSVVIRQFTIYQATITGTTSGTITLEYTDREDQAITAWLDDWREKIWGRNNRYTFRKEDTIADGKLVMYNSSRKPIRTYVLRTMQPTDIGSSLNPQFNSDDPSNQGDISATFNFEHYELLYNNIDGGDSQGFDLSYTPTYNGK